MPCRGPFAFAVGKERAAWLSLGNQPHHIADLPCLASLQRGVAYPVALHRYNVAVVYRGDIGRIYIVGVDAHRGFKTSKNLVANQHSPAGVAHDNRSRFCLAVVNGINHRFYVVHGNVLP